MIKDTFDSYIFVKTLDEGLYGLEHSRWGRQLWVHTKVRKRHKCAVTGVWIYPGEPAYRPLSNAGNRMVRISFDGMAGIVPE